MKKLFFRHLANAANLDSRQLALSSGILRWIMPMMRCNDKLDDGPLGQMRKSTG